MASAQQVVLLAIEDLNGLLPREQRVTAAPETKLLGEGSTLDSLALVNLIVSLEQRVEEATGVALTLVADDALFQPHGPLASVGTLTDYVAAALRERGHV
jgi:acyl carrier protein